MTEYKSVAAYIQEDGLVEFVVSTEILDGKEIDQLAKDLGVYPRAGNSYRESGWWLIRDGVNCDTIENIVGDIINSQ